MLLIFTIFSVLNTAQALSSGQTFDVLAPESAYGASVKYDIFRNNKAVGQHTLEFNHGESGLQVMMESRIVVTIMRVPVFRYRYRAEEQWQGGRLQSVEIVVVEMGKTKKATLKAEGSKQVLHDMKGNRSAASLAYTSNHWHPGVLDDNRFFNTLTGRANRYKLTEVGKEILRVSGSKISSTRYRYSGGLNSDVWYDEQGRWVQLRFLADDGSTIEYRLAAPFLNR